MERGGTDRVAHGRSSQLDKGLVYYFDTVRSLIPTLEPTLHPCDDGTHTCDLLTTMCVAKEEADATTISEGSFGQGPFYTCQCKENYIPDSTDDYDGTYCVMGDTAAPSRPGDPPAVP